MAHGIAPLVEMLWVDGIEPVAERVGMLVEDVVGDWCGMQARMPIDSTQMNASAWPER